MTVETVLADPEAEAALIGAMFRDTALSVNLGVEPGDFHVDANQRLWALAQRAHRAGRPFAVSTVVAEIPQLGDYLRACSDLPDLPEDIRRHAATVRDMAARRRLRAMALAAAEESASCECSVDELVAGLIRDVGRLTRSRSARGKRAAAEAVTATLTMPLPSYATGLRGFDEAIGGGLFAGKTYGVAARKKVGKTVLLGTVSHNLNAREVSHLFIALEMSDEEIEMRNMARHLRINPSRFLESADLWGSDLKRDAARYVASVPDATVYEHVPGASLDEVRRMVAQAVVAHGIKGVILDYWQLVGGKAKNETEEFHLRSVAQWLADTCRRHGLWSLVAAQVNQEGNTRGGEGLKLACDCYFTLHREKGETWAWMQMEESRYVRYQDVGSKAQPALKFVETGPYFADAA